MLTIFSCPKPFTNPRIALIQRNAIRSWTFLQPRPEIILFGDEDGTAEICKSLALRQVPHVARNEFKTPLVNDIFNKAQELASTNLLCYVNADIILMSNFMKALLRVMKWRKKFLMIGRRWDMDVNEQIDFRNPRWEESLLERLKEKGTMHSEEGIDYFVFTKGLFMELPPFALGRTAWDNYLVYKARAMRAPVIDASEKVIAIHQNHDYSHYPGGMEGIWKGKEAQQNMELAGGWKHIFTICDATHILTESGPKFALRKKYIRRHLSTLEVLFPSTRPLIRLLEIIAKFTKPIRVKLGITLQPENDEE